MTRYFGPVQDAGVAIRETDGEKPITASTLGSTAFTGILERGEVGAVITTTSKKDMLAKVGGLIPDSLLPDCCSDFWDSSQGAGVLFLYRVTDGTEVQSDLILYDRKSPRNQVVQVKAHDGGWWGGRRDNVVCDLDNVTDVGTTTITLPALYVVAKNKWKDGTITIHGQTGDYTYNILSNTAGDGITGAVLTLPADADADTDYGTSTDLEVVLKTASQNVWGEAKKLAVVIRDGEVLPSSEWCMDVYLNDVLVKSFNDLSSDPNSAKYFVNKINDDTSNYYVTVTDLWSGAITAAVRPANFYAPIDAGEITATSIDLSTVATIVDSSAAGSNTLSAITFGADVIVDTYELEYTAAWAFTSLDKQAHHTFPVPASGVPEAADNAYSIGYTVTESAPQAGEKFTIYVIPLWTDEAIDGKIYFPDESFAPATGWRINDNDELSVSIATGDMTDSGSISGDINVRLEYKQELTDGYEGIWDVDHNDFLPAYDVNTSPYNDLVNKGYGLIKHAAPGVTNISGVTHLTVQTAGRAYAEAKNHQFRYELPSSYTEEVSARDYVNDSLGRSDYVKVCYHSWCKVSDPVLSGLLKQIPTAGMIMGAEAAVARNYEGYHKVAAGLDVKFSRIRELLTLDAVANGEILNPAGLQRIDKRQGNYVLWGARIPYSDSNFTFCNHREQLSYYEHVLQESYDWIIFMINDRESDALAAASARSFFEPEWKKRALQGSTFTEACIIKVDDENNTTATRAAGEKHMEIKLWLADTTEKFIISIGKQGIFENTESA